MGKSIHPPCQPRYWTHCLSPHSVGSPCKAPVLAKFNWQPCCWTRMKKPSLWLCHLKIMTTSLKRECDGYTNSIMFCCSMHVLVLLDDNSYFASYFHPSPTSFSFLTVDDITFYFPKRSSTVYTTTYSPTCILYIFPASLLLLRMNFLCS